MASARIAPHLSFCIPPLQSNAIEASGGHRQTGVNTEASLQSDGGLISHLRTTWRFSATTITS